MFKKIYASFSGTIDRVIMQGGDGSIVQQGQALFRITPDEKFVEVDLVEVERQTRTRTDEYLRAVC